MHCLLVIALGMLVTIIMSQSVQKSSLPLIKLKCPTAAFCLL
ncbi:hypothetical protein Zm00014a_035787 [Zea mays]|uniref:Uncharacterized protein n=1 Tax=Zea mays TaxID=4577 RepID=A0A317Y795_MAIZE|nr:hypothetical protein Zm00014a_035787 [Zea mays]